MSSLPAGYPIIEVHIPEKQASTIAGYYQTTLDQQLLQIQQLQHQVTDLRQQGHGFQEGFRLLHQCSQVKDETVVQVVHKFGKGVESCVTSLVGSPQDQWTVQQGLRCIALYSQQVGAQEIFHTGGFEAVVQAMNNFPEDVMIQQYGQQLVAYSGTLSDYSREWFNAGAIVTIIRNLNYFTKDTRVQQFGRWALGELAQLPECGQEIVQVGGIQSLVNALQHFAQDPSVVRYA